VVVLLVGSIAWFIGRRLLSGEAGRSRRAAAAGK
jgi:hypothetical protein